MTRHQLEAARRYDQDGIDKGEETGDNITVIGGGDNGRGGSSYEPMINVDGVVPLVPVPMEGEAQVVSIDGEMDEGRRLSSDGTGSDELSPLVSLSSRNAISVESRTVPIYGLLGGNGNNGGRVEGESNALVGDDNGHYGVYEHIYQQQNNGNALSYGGLGGDGNGGSDFGFDNDPPPGPVFQDKIFGVLFLVHLAVMIFLGTSVAPSGYEHFGANFNQWQSSQGESLVSSIANNDDDTMSPEDWEKFQTFLREVGEYVQVYPVRIVLFVVIPCVELAFIDMAVWTAYVVRPHALWWVTASILTSLGVVLSLLLIGFLASPSVPWFLFLLVVGTGICYSAGRILWPMRAFAAANLHMSLSGLASNCGTYIMALVFSELSFIWVVFWGYTSFGVLNYLGSVCESRHPEAAAEQLGQGESEAAVFYHNSECDDQGWAVVLLLLSLYWTSNVLMNTVQVTVAGVIATWCFDKDAAIGCCSSAVSSSLYRSVTYSFGSICFGSLMQGIVSVLRVLVQSLRNQRRDAAFSENHRNEYGLLLCVLECLVKLLEDVLDYFNQWAYVFVGIYGYSYLESGRRVMDLFKRRGVSSIVTDSLVGFVLSYTCVVVGITTGLIAVVLDQVVSGIYLLPTDDVDSYIFGPLPSPGIFAFFTGLIVGMYISSVMASVIQGAVNTVIVCYADAPSKLIEDHPKLTAEMEDAWSVLTPPPRPANNTNEEIEPLTI